MVNRTVWSGKGTATVTENAPPPCRPKSPPSTPKAHEGNTATATRRHRHCHCRLFVDSSIIVIIVVVVVVVVVVVDFMFALRWKGLPVFREVCLHHQLHALSRGVVALADTRRLPTSTRHAIACALPASSREVEAKEEGEEE